MTIRAVGTRVLIKRLDETTEETKSGLIMPAESDDRPAKGEVISVGEKVERALTIGEIVICSRYGEEFRLDGEKYSLIEEDNVYGVVEA